MRWLDGFKASELKLKVLRLDVIHWEARCLGKDPRAPVEV